MNFKKARWGLCFLGAVLPVFGSPAREAFLAGVFSPVPVIRHLALKGEAAAAAEAMSGARSAGGLVPYWSAGGKSVWILETRGKTGRIEAAFAIEEGRILRSEVLYFGDNRGRQIRSQRFLKQFNGVFLKEDQTLSRKIDGYSGATYSVDAMHRMARLALFFNSMLPGSGE